MNLSEVICNATTTVSDCDGDSMRPLLGVAMGRNERSVRRS
jgi:hypothetical protein